MIIQFTSTAIAELNEFTRNKPIAHIVEYENNLNTEIENAYLNRTKGIRTNTPLLPEWEGKYKQLYCKNSGWFFAYKLIRGGIKVQHAVHQSCMKDTKGIGQNITMNPKQDLSAVTVSWTYVRDAHYGFCIVKRGEFEYNYTDLNGNILFKDEQGNPLWFDNVSPFSEGYLETLSAYGIKNGYIVFFYSNGKYRLTNTLASKYGFTNTTILENKQSRLERIITEVLNDFFRKELLTA